MAKEKKLSAKEKLRAKLQQNSTIKETELLSESTIFLNDLIDTEVPILNLAHSGRFNGGIGPGLTMIAGASKSFKTGFMLLHGRAFLKAREDGMLLAYINEFGSPEAYWNNADIPLDNVVQTPIMNIEQATVDLAKQLDELTVDDDVMFLFDSLGNLASVYEAKAAIKGDVKEDAGRRAKSIKSMFRIITPYLAIKKIPMIMVNHVYDSFDQYAPPTVSGGSGPYLSADNIWRISRKQVTEEQDKKKILTGFNFEIIIEKSRFVKEKSRFPINISFDEGIDKYTGIFELVEEANLIGQVTKGGRGGPATYTFLTPETGEIIGDPFVELTDEQYETLLKDKYFNDWCTKKYTLSDVKMLKSRVKETEMEKKGKNKKAE